MSEDRGILADLVLIAVVLLVLAAAGVGVAILVKHLVADRRSEAEAPAVEEVRSEAAAPVEVTIAPVPEPSADEFRLTDLVDAHLPPRDAPLPWIHKRIVPVLQRLGLRGQDVEIKEERRERVRGRSDGIDGVDELFVQLRTNGTFQNMTQLVAELETVFPYMRIDTLYARSPRSPNEGTRFELHMVFPALPPVADEAVHTIESGMLFRRPTAELAKPPSGESSARDPFVAPKPAARPTPKRPRDASKTAAGTRGKPKEISQHELAALKRSIRLSGIMGDRVIIDGSILQKGESFRAQARGRSFEVHVVRAADENRSVVLRVGTEEFTVAMPGP